MMADLSLPSIEDLKAALAEAEGNGDVKAAEFYKGQIARFTTRPPTPGAAANSGTPSDAAKDGGSSLARKALAVGVTAPAAALAGMYDLIHLGARKAGEERGWVDPTSPSLLSDLSGKVQDLETTIAGERVPPSAGKAAFQGAVMAPLSAPKTLATALQATAAGAAGGATAEGMVQAGGNPVVAFLASLLAGKAAGSATGRIPYVNGLRPSESLVRDTLKQSVSGVSPQRLREGTVNQMEAAGEGVNLLPSQAIPGEVPELQRLQESLLRSRAKPGWMGPGADTMRAQAMEQPAQVEGALRRAEGLSGVTPRGDVDLAEALQNAATKASKERYDAINRTTKPLYNDPAATNQQFNAALGSAIARNFTAAIGRYNGEPLVQNALAHVRDQLVQLTSTGAATPKEVNKLLSHLSRNFLPDMNQISSVDTNRVRGVVERMMAPIQQEVNRRAPTIGSANAIQSQMRSQLPGDFDDVFRTARASGGPDAMLSAAAKRPGLVPETFPYDPDATKELLQRTVSKAIDTALSDSTRTGAQKANAGLTAKQALTEGLSGESLQKNLLTLFSGSPNPQSAVEGFNRILRVAGNASRPSGLGAGLEQPISGVSEAVRGGLGSNPQRVNVMGRIAQTVMWKNLRDRATIGVLTRPDVMMRLEKIASIPEIKLTPAMVGAILPELVQPREEP